ncbi:MAG: HDOD domain-containing protein [Deltaproteobacteria bacterium]|nr:HDOD domain-containing protein [Deltaproteobacteria bacterium]
MDDQLLAKLTACETLPSLPAVAVEIVQLCRSEDVELKTIGKVLEKDPALAAKLLKVANSALFSRSGKTTTIANAVLRLGLNAVVTLALSFSLVKIRKSPKSGFDYPRFWKRALISATAARCLAARVSLNREELFLAGLMQDIGMLALCEALGAPYAKVAAKAQGDHAALILAEQESFGADHMAVGEWMARRWNFPDYVAQAILASHDPVVAGSDTQNRPLICECVALSGHVADIWMASSPGDQARVAARLAKRWVGLDAPTFSEFLQEVTSEIPELASLLELPAVDGNALSLVIEQAREALVMISLKNVAMANEACSAAQSAELEKKEAASQRDTLTGLASRAYLETRASQMFDQARSTGTPLTVLLASLDASIARGLGAQPLDLLLKDIATVLERCMPSQAVAGRHDKLVFALLLPGTPGSAARSFADRLFMRIAEMRVWLDDGRYFRPTISVGHASAFEGWQPASLDVLMRAAQGCLVVAQRSGPNRASGYRHDPGRVPAHQ